MSTLSDRTTAFQCEALPYFDLELRVGVIVTPIPVGLLISLAQPGKIVVFSMILLTPHAIGTVLVIVPLMIVIVPGVVVTPIVLLLALVVAVIALGVHGHWNC